MTKDLTVGSPTKLIIQFTLPLLLGMLFQQFYNLVDTVIVGKFVGVDALAGVGATGSINFLILGFCLGTCGGFSIPIAQEFGAKNYTALRQYAAASVYLGVAVSALLTFVSVFWCRDILRLLQTPEDIFEPAYEYIVTIFWGIPTIVLYNTLAGIMRSLGDSKSPVAFLILSAILNVVLDLVFILVFHWGVFGAAAATVISQGISGVISYIYMVKKFDILKMQKDDWKFRPRVLGRMCYISVPMGLQYSITAVGSVILTKAVNTLGSAAVAAVTAAGRLNGLTCCAMDALASTMATYCGQNVGAGKLDRVKKGEISAWLLGTAYSVVAFIVVYFLCDYLLLMFLDSDQTVILSMARQFMVITTAFYVLLMLVNVVRLSIQGMGFSVLAITAGVLEMIARVLVAVFMVPAMGYFGACCSNPAAWIAADAFLIPAFFFCLRRLGKKMEKPAAGLTEA